MPELRIGTSGYAYDHWRGRFYPPGLDRSAWLAHHATRFDSVEIDSTFYGLPDRDSVRRWRDSVPADFRFAVKLSRYGTHMKRLRDPAAWLDRFADAIEPLGPKLGPVLVQLPPRWHRDPERLARFLEAAPSRWRISVEVRDRSWLDRSVYDVLREHAAALCIHDLIDDHPRVLTAGWVYLRMHGPSRAQPYTGGYSPQALAGLARRVRRYLDAGLDTYAYFNNDVGGHAVEDASTLKRLVGASGPRSPRRARAGARPHSGRRSAGSTAS